MQHKKAYVPMLMLTVLLFTIIQTTLLSPKTQILTASALETPKSVQAYWDPNCQNIVKSLEWGLLWPGTTQKFDIYLRNEGDKSVSLELITENWLPTDAEQNMALSWNYSGCPIYSNQVKNVKLELSVFPKIQGVTNFSFDIVIDCEECNLSLGEVAKEKILNAPANTVYFIYGDPSRHSEAEAAYDGTSGEIIRALCLNTQHYGFNTRQDWLLASGEVNTTTIYDSTVVLFGGRYANLAVNYYETIKEVTPVSFSVNESYIIFENRTGTVIGTLPVSVIESPEYSEDMFIVMVFYDGTNTFLVLYGVGWKGTWASGIYFSEVISKNLDTYTNGYYLFHWIDQKEKDGIPQSHEIHQEA